MSTPIICVTGLVLSGDKVALIRSRKPGRAWELPGGKVTPEDRGDWRVALSREIREETGMVIKPSAWSVVDVLVGQPTPGAMFPSMIIVARTAARGALTAGDDAADAGWFGRDDLPSPLSKLESRRALAQWVDAATDDLRAAVLAYCDAVNGGMATTAEKRFRAMQTLAKLGI